jgi:hypothetical protein
VLTVLTSERMIQIEGRVFRSFPRRGLPFFPAVAQKNGRPVHATLAGRKLQEFPLISEAIMSVPVTERPINIIALMDSIRRFVADIELRADAIEIMHVEDALWDIVLEQDLRRHKAPPVKLPSVRRIDPCQSETN